MKTEYLVAVDDFCANHNIEVSFISSLQQSGLIEITTKKEKIYLEATQLQQVEKFIRFYYEFDINLEGIETITHLLQRLNSQQEEIIMLRNRLRFYESEE
ncbi:MAG: MerR family transcriptional regulator [Bacteroidales bacterium]|nr:MerR family transcriptional regulator [Bacteroidales bacterium]